MTNLRPTKQNNTTTFPIDSMTSLGLGLAWTSLVVLDSHIQAKLAL